MTESTHWLFVVRREEHRLYEHLRRAFEGVELVEVILDRRHAEPCAGAPTVEGERRAPLIKEEQGQDWRIYRASGRR